MSLPYLRPIVICAGLVAVWQAIVSLSGVPAFILPAPYSVLLAIVEDARLLAGHAGVTFIEIALGLLLGVLLGAASGIAMSFFVPVRRWLFPVLVVSQAIPVFALAPILVLWLGFGIGSKVAMATLIIFFPVTAALYDGLRRTEPGLLDMARTMDAGRFAILRHVRLPMAMPAFASGIRIAAAVAPIGAVVGEWVGASSGLGALMIHANARSETDTMFAALFVLAVMAVTLYFAIDLVLRRLITWQPETYSSDD